MKIKKDIYRKASKVKLLILDVDGVLTDGRLYYTDDGKEIKAFNVLDGHGIVMLKNCGINVAIISGRRSKCVSYRAKELGVKYVFQGVYDKVKVMERILQREKITREHICYIGDDITDIPLLRAAGFSVSVSNGQKEVKSVVDYITTKKGGDGAVREVSELILKSKGLWDGVLSNY